MKFINHSRVLLVFLFVVSYGLCQAQSAKKILVNVTIQEKENQPTMQRYEKLKDGAQLVYMPNKAFSKARIFRLELDPSTTRKKYPEAILTELKIQFFAGEDVQIGVWKKSYDKPRHKGEIYAGMDDEPKLMKRAKYAVVTAKIKNKNKELLVKTYIRLKNF